MHETSGNAHSIFDLAWNKTVWRRIKWHFWNQVNVCVQRYHSPLRSTRGPVSDMSKEWLRTCSEGAAVVVRSHAASWSVGVCHSASPLPPETNAQAESPKLLLEPHRQAFHVPLAISRCRRIAKKQRWSIQNQPSLFEVYRQRFAKMDNRNWRNFCSKISATFYTFFPLSDNMLQFTAFSCRQFYNSSEKLPSFFFDRLSEISRKRGKGRAAVPRIAGRVGMWTADWAGRGSTFSAATPRSARPARSAVPQNSAHDSRRNCACNRTEAFLTEAQILAIYTQNESKTMIVARQRHYYTSMLQVLSKGTKALTPLACLIDRKHKFEIWKQKWCAFWVQPNFLKIFFKTTLTHP